jgi:hypothetical protein
MLGGVNNFPIRQGVIEGYPYAALKRIGTLWGKGVSGK